MSVIRSWREYARQYGKVALVKHLGMRLLRPVWEESSLSLFLAQPPAMPISAKVPLHVAKLGEGAAQEAGWLTPEWEKRWARGEVCYGGWVGKQCVHYSWVSRADSYLGEVHEWLQVGNDEAYIYDCFTDGDCRGQRIFPAVLSEITADLFSYQVGRIWIAAEVDNHSSIRSIERAGFRMAAAVLHRRFVTAKRTRIVSGSVRLRAMPSPN